MYQIVGYILNYANYEKIDISTFEPVYVNSFEEAQSYMSGFPHYLITLKKVSDK